MSLWRKTASERLPELQRIIASREVDNPMMLWLELQSVFTHLCQQNPPPLDLIRRLWGYAKWSMAHEDGDVRTAAALAFAEHLLDSKAMRRILPDIMTRSDYMGLRELLLYHNSEEAYTKGLELFNSAQST